MHLIHVFPGNVLVKEIPIKGHFEDVAGESVDVGEFPSLDGRILPKKSDLKIIYSCRPTGQKSFFSGDFFGRERCKYGVSHS